jgi:branched-chain amino acid transport system substrate-binding protein
MRFKTLCAVLTLAVLSHAASAQIRIGQTSGFTGAVASGVKENTEGAKLYFDAVNARGGVNGQAIELVSLDDQFEPKLAAENARKLIADPKVLTLFMIRGTPHTQAVMPLLTDARIPLVAPSTGAMLLHNPVHPWLFNVRATYQREAQHAVQHLHTIGIERFAVIHVDDSFGADSAAGADKGFKAIGKTPVALEKFDRSKPDFSALVPKVVAAQPQAVLFIGSAGAVSEGVAALRTAGSRAQVVTLSNNASAGFIKQLKEHARGTIVTQVFPYERSLATRFVKEALELAKAKGLAEVTPAMLEGFAGAKVVVEGLRRAGPKPTREKLRNALETLNKVDLGGLEISYTARDHSGLSYVDLSIIGPDGRFRR